MKPVTTGITRRDPGRESGASARRAMARRNLLERAVGAHLAALGQAGALNQLVRNALEGGNDDDNRTGMGGLEHDCRDVADALRGGERRAAEFENFHWRAQYNSL